MGTRADFYIGRGLQAVWLGSVAYDGYLDGMPAELLNATTEDAFKTAVASLASRDDWTSVDQGWPWPWEDSRTTDYAYAFDGDKVWASNFGHSWFDASQPEPEGETPKDAVFPNMKDRQNVAFDKRSGLLIIGL